MASRSGLEVDYDQPGGEPLGVDQRAWVGWARPGPAGPITGKGGHLMIVDDPIKNIEDAQSEVMRDKLWEWWQNVFLTRREPGAKMLLIM